MVLSDKAKEIANHDKVKELTHRGQDLLSQCRTKIAGLAGSHHHAESDAVDVATMALGHKAFELAESGTLSSLALEAEIEAVRAARLAVASDAGGAE